MTVEEVTVTAALMLNKDEETTSQELLQEMTALLLLGHKERHKLTQTAVQNSGGSHNPILALNPANACADQGHHQQGNIYGNSMQGEWKGRNALQELEF